MGRLRHTGIFPGFSSEASESWDASTQRNEVAVKQKNLEQCLVRFLVLRKGECLCCMACRISFPGLGIEPVPPAVEVYRVLTAGLPGNSQCLVIDYRFKQCLQRLENQRLRICQCRCQEFHFWWSSGYESAYAGDMSSIPNPERSRILPSS